MSRAQRCMASTGTAHISDSKVSCGKYAPWERNSKVPLLISDLWSHLPVRIAEQ